MEILFYLSKQFYNEATLHTYWLLNNTILFTFRNCFPQLQQKKTMNKIWKDVYTYTKQQTIFRFLISTSSKNSFTHTHKYFICTRLVCGSRSSNAIRDSVLWRNIASTSILLKYPLYTNYHLHLCTVWLLIILHFSHLEKFSSATIVYKQWTK